MAWYCRLAACALFFALSALAGEHDGQVTFGGLPLPGATVTATQGDQKLTAVTDARGVYSFPDLADGRWTIRVEMLLFAPLQRDVTAAAGAPPDQWEMTMLPADQIKAAPMSSAPAVLQPAQPPPTTPAAKPAATPATAQAPPPPPANDSVDTTAELTSRATDGFLVNGTQNNGAASPFAQAQAFGNNRNGGQSLYNGSLGLTFDNSALDAQSFSVTGQQTPKPGYNRLTGFATLGGPLKIPHLIRNGPVFFVAYQWLDNHTVATTPGLVPTLDQRAAVTNPQAQALLAFFPLPNFTGGTRYNYQAPLVTTLRQNTLQSRLTKNVNQRNTVFGNFSFIKNESGTPNLLGYSDTTRTFGVNTNANWTHRFGQRLMMHSAIAYSRLSTRVTPFFADRTNVSEHAGVTGNDQDPIDWGPPTLNFSSGITSLTDATAAFNRNQTTQLTWDVTWNRQRHNIQFGVDARRQDFNYLSQQNPRGTFTFTGAATGTDFGDFAAGIPDVSNIAFGNADKYFRQWVYDAFLNDDFRINPSLTINAGLRWEYEEPITEKYGRLVNLAIGPEFTTATPVIAAHDSSPLVNADHAGIEPRVGLAWRPFSGSSTVVRAGYGVYFNTSVYQAIMQQMAQQYPLPLTRSFSVQNSAADPLTLANGFNASPLTTQTTFALDPNFRIGFAHNWQASIQRDLPGSLVATVTYQGIKGTRGMQEFLPNTYPAGAVNPCPACPAGFIYLTSNGNSTRESGQLQLRRRLHNGITASLQYTYSKSIDDSASGGRNQGGQIIAQNWLDLSAERGLSNFDQRHLLNVTGQYTSGMGIGGGTLMNGWRGALLKEWTISTTITAGSGLPLTPTIIAPSGITGVTGTLRPDYTGVSVYGAPAGLFLNSAAYAAPVPGQWGNAGRNSIEGPDQFSLNASLGRTFRLRDKLNLDVRVDATNALNHVVFPSWNTVVGSLSLTPEQSPILVRSPTFGLPTAANQMRSLTTTFRLRF
jgi:hypothetical protein